MHKTATLELSATLKVPTSQELPVSLEFPASLSSCIPGASASPKFPAFLALLPNSQAVQAVFSLQQVLLLLVQLWGWGLGDLVTF